MKAPPPAVPGRYRPRSLNPACRVRWHADAGRGLCARVIQIERPGGEDIARPSRPMSKGARSLRHAQRRQRRSSPSTLKGPRGRETLFLKPDRQRTLLVEQIAPGGHGPRWASAGRRPARYKSAADLLRGSPVTASSGPTGAGGGTRHQLPGIGAGSCLSLGPGSLRSTPATPAALVADIVRGSMPAVDRRAARAPAVGDLNGEGAFLDVP